MSNIIKKVVKYEYEVGGKRFKKFEEAVAYEKVVKIEDFVGGFIFSNPQQLAGILWDQRFKLLSVLFDEKELKEKFNFPKQKKRRGWIRHTHTPTIFNQIISGKDKIEGTFTQRMYLDYLNKAFKNDPPIALKSFRSTFNEMVRDGIFKIITPSTKQVGGVFKFNNDKKMVGKEQVEKEQIVWVSPGKMSQETLFPHAQKDQIVTQNPVAN
jgi:hypothetical protein